MRKNFLLYAAIGALALIGATIYATGYAKAADKGGIVTRAEAEQMFPTNPWTAVYAGIGVGTGALTSDYGIGVDGIAFSGRVGADVQIGRILFGLLADARYDHVSTTYFSADPKEWMVAARAGVLVSDHVLAYGLVGENWLSVSGMKTQGIALGGGLETAVTKNWRLGLEYLHVTYDDIPSAREQTVTARLIFAFPR